MKGLQFFGNRVEDAANAFIDVLKYSDPYEDYSTMNINPTIEIGSTWEQALKIALNSEIETIGHY